MAAFDERLSAYLDGELDPAETASIDAELADSESARAELESLRHTRDLLAGLPLVDVPEDFVFAPARPAAAEAKVIDFGQRRRARRVFARSVVAVAAAFALLVGVGSVIPGSSVVPAIDDFVSVHSAAAEVMDLDGAHMPDDMIDEMDGMGPDVGEAMPMMGAAKADSYIHLVYGSADNYVSVFRQEGRLADDKMVDAAPMAMPGGTTAYQTHSGALTVLIVETDGLVYTIITGDTMMDDAMAMADKLPDDDDNFVENAFENLF